MKIEIPKKIKDMMETLEANKFEAYIIGGAIRDSLLRIEPKDYDLFSNATGEQILKLFPDGKVIGGEERQEKILTVIVDGVEISQYRKNGDRTKTGTSLEEHQATCDFTINAIAADIDGNIIDNHYGEHDITNRLLKFVGDPEQRIKEDPLRILRGIRFWTKYKMIFEDILIVIDNIDLLDDISTERIREELLKIIKYSEGITNLWCDRIMYKIFPELQEVVGMSGGEFHDEDVDRHMINCFKEACKITDDVRLRLAIFLHDIGKGKTYTIVDGNQTHFYKHENVGAVIVNDEMQRLKFSNEDIKYVTALINLHMYSYRTNPCKKSYIRFFNKLNDAGIDIMSYIILIYCDHQGNNAKPRIKFGDFVRDSWLLKKYNEITYSEEPMTVKDLKVGGLDIMKYGIKGKKVGDVLKRMFEMVMDGEIKNERAELLHYLKEVLK